VGVACHEWVWLVMSGCGLACWAGGCDQIWLGGG
jgi:hypothetical protein